MFPSTFLTHLRLFQFRNYSQFSLALDEAPVILTGNNGAGKTNILEAISLLSPGRGLRKAPLSLLQRMGDEGWSVVADISPSGIRIGTGVEPQSPEKRLVKINGDLCPHSHLEEWLKVLWVTPAMDRLFLEAPSMRRQFFDRLIMDPGHSKRLYRYEHALRERSRLLQQGKNHQEWLTVLEKTMAEESVALIASRQDLVETLNQCILKTESAFPKAHLTLVGEIESLLTHMPAIAVEERIQIILFQGRAQDAQRGGARIGAHQTDLKVYNLDFNYPAEVCSTGEQKALLLSVILAHGRWVRHLTRSAPILLLDEVVAHLDEERRETLFNDIDVLKMQAWLTGTDGTVFKNFFNRAQHIRIGT